MTLLDKAKEAVPSQVAQVVGMWLGTHLDIPSIGPATGVLLSRLAQQADKMGKSETNPIIQHDVAQFIAALDLVCQVELIHQAVVITKLQQALSGSAKPTGAGEK